jgi:hypothetical protein
VSPRLSSLRNHDVDTRFDVSSRVFDGASKGRNFDALLPCRLDHPLGRRAKRTRDQTDLVLKNEFDDFALLFVAHRELAADPRVFGQFRDTMVFEQFIDEGTMFVGDVFVEFFSALTSGVASHKFSRQQEVDAKRFVTDFVFDPLKFTFECIDGMTRNTQDAKASGLGHSRSNVAAVREGKDWKFESEFLGDLGVHRSPPYTALIS